MTVRVKLWLGAMACAVVLLVVARLLASALESWIGAAGLTLALFAPAGWLLARLAYHPVRSVTKTARSITATGELDRRCFYPGPRDDVGDLVATVNELLVRYDAAIGRLRRQQAADRLQATHGDAAGPPDLASPLDPADLVVVDLRRPDEQDVPRASLGESTVDLRRLGE
jgi:hypothetical protein